MTFSVEWEALYAAGRHQVLWPWTNVVTYVSRYAKGLGRSSRILELGCGPGTNLPFLASFGAELCAMDGSASVIEIARRRFPDQARNILVADFTQAIPVEGTFDLIVERASVAHNDIASIRRCIALIRDRLKPGGRFIGLDWFSTEHTEFSGGCAGSDPLTRCGYGAESYAFADAGTVHFADRPHMFEFFTDFNVLALHHNAYRHDFPENGYTMATWNIVAEKPAQLL